MSTTQVQDFVLRSTVGSVCKPYEDHVLVLIQGEDKKRKIPLEHFISGTKTRNDPPYYVIRFLEPWTREITLSVKPKLKNPSDNYVTGKDKEGNMMLVPTHRIVNWINQI